MYSTWVYANDSTLSSDDGCRQTRSTVSRVRQRRPWQLEDVPAASYSFYYDTTPPVSELITRQQHERKRFDRDHRYSQRILQRVNKVELRISSQTLTVWTTVQVWTSVSYGTTSVGNYTTVWKQSGGLSFLSDGVRYMIEAAV